MEEATKYIGWPYVWGGSSPSTSFDCSGFVCWVYTASGVHNLPRTTAQGIYNQCAIISPSEAKPGDIIFSREPMTAPALCPMWGFMWATDDASLWFAHPIRKHQFKLLADTFLCLRAFVSQRKGVLA